MANRIFIQVDFATDTADKAIDELNKKIDSIGKHSEDSTKHATVSIGGFTSAMLKSTAGAIGLVTSIQGTAQALGEFVVSAFKGAAAMEILEKTNNALARSVGISTQAVEGLRDHFDKLGTDSVEAAKALNRLLTSTDIVNPKAIENLQDFAKTLQRISGHDVVDNFERITDAIATGQAKTLKEVGVRIDFAALEAQRELDLARRLSDREKQQLRLNAILEKSRELAKAGDTAAGGAAERIQKLQTQWSHFKDEVGKGLLEVFGTLTDWYTKLSDAIEKLGKQWDAIRERNKPLESLPKGESALSLLFKGKVGPGSLVQPVEPKAEPKVVKQIPTNQPGGSDIGGSNQKTVEQINEEKEARRRLAELSLQLGNELLQQQKEVRSVQADIAQQRTAELATVAQTATSNVRAEEALLDVANRRAAARKQGLADLEKEAAQILQNKTHYIDEFGKVQDIAIRKAESSKLQQIADDKAFAFQEKFDAETQQIIQRVGEARAELNRARIEAAESFRRTANERIADTQLDAARQGAEDRTQIELVQLQLVDAVTVRQKLALEQKKTEIEIQGLRERTRLEEIAIDNQTQRAVAAKIRELDYVKGVTAAQLRRNEQEQQLIRDEGEEQKIALAERTNRAIEQIQVQGTANQQQILLEKYRDTYQKIKDFGGQLFDALFDKSKSTFEAIADVFKNAFTTALKEIVTSQFAIAFYKLLGYGNATSNGPGQAPNLTGPAAGGAGGGGGVASLALGSLQNLAFGGQGGFGVSAATPPFIGGGGGGAGGGLIYDSAGRAVGSSAAGGAGGVSQSPAGGISQAGQLSGGLKGLLGLGNIGAFGGGAAGAAGALLTSPAAGIGGALLAYKSLQRGGALGVLGSTAGGFLVGASLGFLIGGPIGAALGAAIGTAVGLTAGIVRLFIDSADEKVRQKVQQVYGINITDKKIRAQIVAISQQNYGGNIDVAVRSPEVQKLVQLYALATDQQAKLPRQQYTASFEQSAAGAQLQPVYSNGQLVANPYTGTTTTQWAQAGMYVQLDPIKAQQLFEGRVVNVLQSNPDTVATATAAGTSQGVSRTGLRTSLMEPLSVTR